MFTSQPGRWSRSALWLALSVCTFAAGTEPASPPKSGDMPPLVELTAQQDHQRLMDLLKITELRRGANGRDQTAANAANYDESKANPYPDLPDPLILKNGKKVTAPEAWWNERRPEIVEDFDREIYGRVPKETPKVRWEVTSTTEGKNGDVPIITKQLVGHVDNSAYPLITVDIQLTLTTPAAATAPVPVMMEFGFSFAGFGRGKAPAAAPADGKAAPPAGRGGFGGGGPTWQQQVLARGWGYAILTPNSIQADNGAGLTKGIIGLCNKGQPRKLDDWGALRAWAWGASRALDYFETDKAVDAKQVGIEGLSRYGKAAIVTMAYDQRFAIGFIGSSGEGGVKLHRRKLRRVSRERRQFGRVPLDGRQLSQVRRPADVERPAGRFARAGRHVRPAAGVHQRRVPAGRRRVGRCQGHVPGRCGRRPGISAAGQEGLGNRRISPAGNRPNRRRGGFPPTRRRAHDRTELADVSSVRGSLYQSASKPMKC